MAMPYGILHKEKYPVEFFIAMRKECVRVQVKWPMHGKRREKEKKKT